MLRILVGAFFLWTMIKQLVNFAKKVIIMNLTDIDKLRTTHFDE